jgi:hypothetical protein
MVVGRAHFVLLSKSKDGENQNNDPSLQEQGILCRIMARRSVDKVAKSAIAESLSRSSFHCLSRTG